jgi:hypothetical protein
MKAAGGQYRPNPEPGRLPGEDNCGATSERAPDDQHRRAAVCHPRAGARLDRNGGSPTAGFYLPL